MCVYHDLLSEHAGPSLLRQDHLASLLGEHTWDADLNRGLLHISTSHRPYAAQLLGTELERDASWRWGWANTGSGLSDEVLKDSRQVLAYGIEHGVSVLTTPTLNTRKTSGIELAMIARGITGAGAYFKGDFPGGAAYFLLHDVPEAPPLTAQHSVHLITTLVRRFELNHPNTIRALFTAQNCPISIQGATWMVQVGSETVRLIFDEHHRLTSVATPALA
ncbi:hypothetical protein LAJ19_20480 (plasmid) [Deinococcus taeanensis]|uniref:DUF6882 domain-containing protein n=1 Tax=Deinococcus taeanensis TaxID=2737050 RepID=UPI001CDBFA2E|nr:DUF6882 domain-containing protein [Deinococcus taeanensis]UBV45187.1 hypothetical protein LAJ19_20480 [Deinococcus taeanensis]